MNALYDHSASHARLVAFLHPCVRALGAAALIAALGILAIGLALSIVEFF